MISKFIHKNALLSSKSFRSGVLFQDLHICIMQNVYYIFNNVLIKTLHYKLQNRLQNLTKKSGIKFKNRKLIRFY